MRAMRVSEIVAATGGRCLGEADGALLRGVSTDTRTLRPGEAFVALKGERFDGHDFVPAALAAGAAAVVAEDRREIRRAALESRVPFVLVDDTTLALGRMAVAYRRALDGTTVVAVTGSNGKTTTKEMIYRALSRRGPVVRSVRSFNNHVGVPLTLFSVEPGHRWAVLELGTNAPGEIAALAEMARPHIGVVTNIAETHLAGLGDREGVARAKGELVAALPADGCAVLNRDDPLCANLARLTEARVVFFGRDPAADVFVTDIRPTGEGISFRLNGRRLVRLRVLGEHNALNAAAAVAVCRRLGLSEEEVVSALEAFSGVPKRLRVRRRGGVTILDDTYNANPGSMQGALGVLAGFPCRGRRVMVCGDMRELGAASRRLHRDLAGNVGEGAFHHRIAEQLFHRREGAEERRPILVHRLDPFGRARPACARSSS